MDFKKCLSDALHDFGSCCADAGITIGGPFVTCAGLCAFACTKISGLACGACWIGCLGLTGPITLYHFGVCLDGYTFYSESCQSIMDNCPCQE